MDLRMGTVRALVQAHARTCFGAAFVAPPPALVSSSVHTSSSHGGSGVCGETDEAGAWTRPGAGAGTGSRSGRHCLTWSSDCSVRLWDITTDGVITHPLDTLEFPQYPVYCCAVRTGGAETAPGGRAHPHTRLASQLACVGGSGDTSFVGTPVHLLVPRVS